MIHKIEFSAKNLTSNAGLFLLLEHANKNGIFDLIDNDLIFENASTNKINLFHVSTCYLYLSQAEKNHFQRPIS